MKGYLVAGIQIYNSVTLAMGYFVDKHSKNSVHVYIR